MKSKQTQEERIKNKLIRDGFITRNECIKNYITRLSAYILILKKEGWEFEVKDKNGDYMYKTTKCPLQTRTMTLSNGEVIKQLIR